MVEAEARTGARQDAREDSFGCLEGLSDGIGDALLQLDLGGTEQRPEKGLRRKREKEEKTTVKRSTSLRENASLHSLSGRPPSGEQQGSR